MTTCIQPTISEISDNIKIGSLHIRDGFFVFRRFLVSRAVNITWGWYSVIEADMFCIEVQYDDVHAYVQPCSIQTAHTHD